MAKTWIYRSNQGKEQVLGYYESLLGEWHQPFSHSYLETSFGNTFIVESGKRGAPAVLLLHGSGSNSAMWIGDAMKWSEEYHVFAIDIVGECGKSAETRPAFVKGHYADWVVEVVDQLALRQVSLIACSLGGWIAMDFASSHPERVGKLVLLSTAGITPVKPRTIIWIIITSMMGKWGFKKLNQMVYGDLKIDGRALGFASLVRKNFRPRTDVLPLLSAESLRKIKAPTLFIGGEHDCFYDSHQTASRLKEHLDQVECLVLKDTGHVVTDQADTILEFLNRI